MLVTRATCMQGKRRVRLTQPPCDCACPSISPGGLNIAEHILLTRSGLSRALGHEPDFVVNDYLLAKGDALHSAAKMQLRATGLPRFISFLQSVLLGTGVSKEEASAFTSYSLRRFLPTAADDQRLA